MARKSVPHAARRAAQRFRLAVDSRTFREWSLAIEAGRAKYLRLLHGDRRLYQLVHEGRPIRVVYDNATRYVVTVLPPPRPGRGISDL